METLQSYTVHPKDCWLLRKYGRNENDCVQLIYILTLETGLILPGNY